jgi:cation transporter-like permease
LLGLGLSSGVVAALLAVLPGSAREVSIIPMAVVVGAVTLSGVIWVAMASAFATRGPLLAALKED